MTDGARNHFHALFEAEAGAFAFVPSHRDDDAVEEFRRSLDDIQMAIGQRIETSRVNHRAHESSLAAERGQPQTKAGPKDSTFSPSLRFPAEAVQIPLRYGGCRRVSRGPHRPALGRGYPLR